MIPQLTSADNGKRRRKIARRDGVSHLHWRPLRGARVDIAMARAETRRRQRLGRAVHLVFEHGERAVFELIDEIGDLRSIDAKFDVEDVAEQFAQIRSMRSTHCRR